MGKKDPSIFDLAHDAASRLNPALKKLKKIFSLEYNDKPLSDKIYDFHRHWLKLLNDFYFRVENLGHPDYARKLAKKENIMVISHHGNTLEAALIGYYFMIHKMGKLRTLVYKEAFRLPLVREFFRSGQCIPISVESGAKALSDGHIMLFPEGMDFIKRYAQKDFVPKFHKGFLNIAKKYMQDNGLEKMHIVPVGHDGIENTVKFWIINNPTLVEKFIKPVFRYPYFVFPKSPIVMPQKTILKWGKPKLVTLAALEDEKELQALVSDFRHEVLDLKRGAARLNRLRKSAKKAPKPKLLEAFEG